MIITHQLGSTSVKKQTDESPMFLLASKTGGFAFLGTDENQTRFQGVYLSNNFEIYKVIENIRLKTGKIDVIRNNFYNIERLSGKHIESFYTNHTNTLLYEINNYKGYIELTLDCRKIYDFGQKGRVYNISNENDCILIEYVKYTDEYLKDVDYRIYLAIKGVNEYEKLDIWEKKFYEIDKKRGSNPFELYVNKILQLKIDDHEKIVFSYSNDRKEALENAKNSMENFDFIKKSKENYIRTLTSSNIKCENGDILLAYKLCINAIDSYIIKNDEMNGIIAGYPWFTQVWTRDEAMSIGSLIIEERFMDVKNILFRQIKNILDDGRIQNRFPHSELGSADGVGWVWKRVWDFLMILKNKERLGEFISHRELLFIKKQLRKSINKLMKYHTKEGLSYNSHLETWMDTGYNEDTREGFRIEIQALRLCMYRLMAYLCSLTNNEKGALTYSNLEQVTLTRVRAEFWKKPILFDGIGDKTIRPNIFISYYVYPELLNRREWKSCFDRALDSLWISWGGIATIDKNHKYFIDTYTGENNRSYHRGDSWFFLNNLTAICLYDLDKSRYRSHIDKIITASTEDILYKGIIGFHSELSSAKKMTSEASQAQTWSSAFFIELATKVFVD